MIQTIATDFREALAAIDSNYIPIFGTQGRYLRYVDKEKAWVLNQTPWKFPFVGFDVERIAAMLNGKMSEVTVYMTSFDTADSTGFNYDVQAERALYMFVNVIRKMTMTKRYAVLENTGVEFFPQYERETFKGNGGIARVRLLTGIDCCKLEKPESKLCPPIE